MNFLPFDYSGNQLTTFTDSFGNPWFNLKELCAILGLANASQVARTHMRNEDLQRMEVLTKGGPQMTNFVNESGLYSLVFYCRKPEALEFKHWLTSEVLPSIRKTGTYTSLPSTSSANSPQTLVDSDRYIALIENLVQQNSDLIKHLAATLGASKETIRESFNVPVMVGAPAAMRRRTLLEALEHGSVDAGDYATKSGLTLQRIQSDIHDLRVRGIDIKTTKDGGALAYVMS